jgi:hypothetical protein
MFEPKKGHGTAVALSQSGAFLRLCGWECQALSWWRAWDGVGMGLVKGPAEIPSGAKARGHRGTLRGAEAPLFHGSAGLAARLKAVP